MASFVTNGRLRARAAMLAIVSVLVLTAVSMPLQALAGGMTWSQFRSGPDHAGFAIGGPQPAAVKHLSRIWGLNMSGRQSDPIVGSGQVFLTTNRSLYAVSASSGREVWSRRWHGPSDPAYYSTCGRLTCGSILYAVDVGAKSSLQAVRPESGKAIWTFRYPELSWPTVAGPYGVPGGQVVYLSSRRGAALAVAASGRRLWIVWPARAVCRRRACFAINSVTPAVALGLVFVTATNGRVYALREGDGKTAWSARIGDVRQGPTSLAVSLGHLLVTTTVGVTSLDAVNGRREWALRERVTGRQGRITGMAAGYGLRPAGGKVLIPTRPTVYVARVTYAERGRRGSVVAIDTSNGHVRWSFPTGAGAAMDPSVSNGVVYLSDSRGSLFAVDAIDGRLITRIARLSRYSPTYPAIAFDWVYAGDFGFAVDVSRRAARRDVRKRDGRRGRWIAGGGSEGACSGHEAPHVATPGVVVRSTKG